MRDIVRFHAVNQETPPSLAHNFITSMDDPRVLNLLNQGIPVIMTKTGPYKKISHKTTKNSQGISQTFWDVEFLNTGYIARNRQGGKNRIDICDPTFPRVKGVGFLGSKECLKTKEGKLLHRIWRNMIDRCYCDKSQSYQYYGAQGVFIDSRWHSFEKFVEDMEKIPGWSLKKDNWSGYSLDKDYLGANMYSKDNCIFLSKRDNELIKTNKLIYAYNEKTGENQFIVDLYDFAEFSGISQHYVKHRLSAPSKNPPCGWKFRRVDTEDFLYRPKLDYFNYGDTFWSPTSSNKDALKRAQEVVNRL